MEVVEIYAYLLKVLLVSIRVAALWIFFPFFSHSHMPVMVRVSGTMALSIALLPAVSPMLPAWSPETPPILSEMLVILVREFLIGAGMGLIAKWFFGVVVSSAAWVGQQMGFSVGGLFNPEMGMADNSSWAEFQNWVGLIFFISIGGHHWFLEAIRDSYVIHSADTLQYLTNTDRGIELWTSIGTSFFSWVLKLAAPLMVAMLILQAGMGVLSKFIPQINVWTVSIPLTLGFGVFLFSLLSPMYGDVLTELFKVGREHSYVWIKYLGG